MSDICKDREALRPKYEQFIQTEKGKEWKHFWQSQTDSERSGDFGDYLYDFYPEMLNIQLEKVRKILKNIEDIIISRARDSEKLEALKQYEDDIKTAKDIINGKLTYCDECKDYYLTKSFFSEKEIVPTKICVYEDPINSGGNDYVDGYADILYSVCPKGHKHVIDRKERRK